MHKYFKILNYFNIYFAGQILDSHFFLRTLHIPAILLDVQEDFYIHKQIQGELITLNIFRFSIQFCFLMSVLQSLSFSSQRLCLFQVQIFHMYGSYFKREIFFSPSPSFFQLPCLARGMHSCGILVPRSGIEPTPPALEVRSLNHWTAREVPILFNTDIMNDIYREALNFCVIKDSHLLNYFIKYLLIFLGFPQWIIVLSINNNNFDNLVSSFPTLIHLSIAVLFHLLELVEKYRTIIVLVAVWSYPCLQ